MESRRVMRPLRDKLAEAVGLVVGKADVDFGAVAKVLQV